MANTAPIEAPRIAKPSSAESRPACSLIAGIREAHEPNMTPLTTKAMTTAALDRPRAAVTPRPSIAPPLPAPQPHPRRQEAGASATRLKRRGQPRAARGHQPDAVACRP